MHVGSWESTRKAFEWHEAKPSASLHVASRVLSQLPKCIHNSIDAQLHVKHGPFLLEHCLFLKNRKLIKYRILLNHCEYFDWLNTITRFDRRTGMCLSRFGCTLVPYKKSTKNCQLCSKRFYSVATPIRVYTVTKPSVPMGMRVWIPALKTMYPEGILSSKRLLGMCWAGWGCIFTAGLTIMGLYF